MASLKTASLEEIREVAVRICRDYLTGQWKFITAEDIVVKRISGGLSNFLYYVSLPEDGSTAAGTNELIEGSREADCEIGCGERKTESSDSRQNDVLKIGDGCGRKRHRSNSFELPATTSGGYIQNTQGKEPREVLLRIYGHTHGENALESMITESVVFALLSERNFGPKLHGIFPGGRIEQYIMARPLATVELSDYKLSMKIADKMGEIHSLNIPMSKEPDWLWNCMDRWLKSIYSILEAADRNVIGADLDEIRSFDFWEERKWLKSVIDCGNFPVLFCHNDLQEGNILLRENESTAPLSARDSLIKLRSNLEHSAVASSGDVSMRGEQNANSLDTPVVEEDSRERAIITNDNGNYYTRDFDNTRDSVLSNNSEDCDPDLIIIDFEYCAYNYRGFDLANHFLEWTFDYSNPEFPFYFYHKCQYPTQQQRQDFIASYLKKLNETNESYVPNIDEIQRVDKEVGIFSMFSHLFWSLWSLVNSTSNIEFGYWKYAVTRTREYKLLKQEYILTHCS